MFKTVTSQAPTSSGLFFFHSLAASQQKKGAKKWCGSATAFKNLALFRPFFPFLPLAAKKVFHNPKNFISHWFSFGYTLFLPFSIFPRPACFSGDFGGLKTTTKPTLKTEKTKRKKAENRTDKKPKK